ncbi:deoxynucleoside kinase-like isoform X2 [Coccinella septempunctata]|nr:deoxynucleoside kinase-like isoform X2 [Coccinella septempunctata]
MENVLLNIVKGANDEKVTSVFSPGKQANFLGISPLKDVETKREGRPFRVSIEGNIGAGKSTCIEYFDKLATVETYAEPIEWWRNVDGENLLELLYTDINKWISVFQSYVQLTRLKVQTTKPKKLDTTVQIFERSIQNNRFCFLEHAYRKGSLTSADYAVLDQWYRWIRANVDINLDLIVYLRTSPEVVYERVKTRNRPEETGLTLEYLKDLHDSHEKWLMSNDERFNNVPLIVLDGNKPLAEMETQYKIFEDQILGRDSRGLKRSNTADELLGRVKKNLREDL